MGDIRQQTDDSTEKDPPVSPMADPADDDVEGHRFLSPDQAQQRAEDARAKRERAAGAPGDEDDVAGHGFGGARDRDGRTDQQ